MMNRASTTITFSAPVSAAGNLSVAVDDEATGASSPYSPGTKVFLRLYGRGTADIAVASLGCRVTLAASGQVSSHTETVKVIKGNRLSLTHGAKRLVDLKWLSVIGDPANAHIDHDSAGGLLLSKEVKLGIAEVTYLAEYDSYVADSLSGQAALITFEASDGRDASADLEIRQLSITRQDVKLTIIDYATNAAIPGANVTVRGPFNYFWSGTANHEGMIQLGSLVSGEYTVLATASGYQNSDQDILANDRFTLE